MIAKYPTEFTFYYPAANMAVEMKKFDQARSYIEKAMEFAYGDNKIRCQERALKVAMAEIKEKKDDTAKVLLKTAIEQSEKFSSEFKKPEGLQVRSANYIKKLNKTIEEAKTLL